MSAPPQTPSEPAWPAFRAAAAASPGYRAHLAAHGVDPTTASDWSALPYTDKGTVFADVAPWVAAPGITGAREIVCSSGQSGPPVSMALVSAAERDAARAHMDGLLAAIGAGPDSPTLLVNVLPMGIAVPTDLATVATPSVHPEMALHVLTSLAPAFDRVVLVGEPLFIAELARRVPAGDVHPNLWIFTGGEPVAAAWGGFVAGALGIEPWRVGVSMGCAEIGLHLLYDTPELAAARRALDADPGLWPDAPWRELTRDAFAPALMTYRHERLLVETRERGGRPSLVMTPREPALLPLVRYDLGDVAWVLGPRAIDRLSAACGVPLPDAVVALAGRPDELATAAGMRLRPEAVKERIFGDPRLATALSGRFRLTGEGDAAVLHVQRTEREADGALADATAELAEWFTRYAGSGSRVAVHSAAEYPFHATGDWTHKPRYTGRTGA